MPTFRTPALSSELSAASLGDPRRTGRLGKVADRLSQQPGLGLPRAMGSDAELEAAYRFFGNEAIGPSAITAPHIAATAERCRSFSTIYAVSDTTEFCFSGDEREGLGYLQGGRRGFHSHFTLAVAGNGSRCPLGILAWQTIVRGPRPKRRRHGIARAADPERESRKWREGAEQSEKALGSGDSVIHVMDREADAYDLLGWMCRHDVRFVIRVARDRKLETEDGLAFHTLFESLGSADALFSSLVPLTPRRTSQKQHAARTQRVAQLRYAVAARTVRRPRTANSDTPSELTLHFVHITEPNPPADQEAIDWKLVTREPISSGQDVLRVVDAYRARWTIEEYFKALKTGCAYEKAQLESFHSLVNYLATLLPVAWQLLMLRNLGRDQPDEPASSVLTPLQLQVLRAMAKRKLPPNPTVKDAMLSIAGMGGHIKNNGAPGWQTLGRGFEDLAKYLAAWMAAKEM